MELARQIDDVYPNAAAPTRRRGSLVAGLAVAGLLVAGLVVSRAGLSTASQWTAVLTGWGRSAGPSGWVLFVAAQMAVAMAGVVPASLLGLAAGAVYGVPGGFLLAALGTMLGGWIAFALARSLLRPWVQGFLARRVNSRLVRLDGAVARDGWRFVCLLRISPVMPFALTSYALGLSKISGRNYLVGTLASLPALLGYVAFGTLARYGVLTAGGTEPVGPFRWVMIGVGVVATVLLILRSGTLLARCGLLPGTGSKPVN